MIRLHTGWSVKTGSLDSKWGNCSNSYPSGTNHRARSFVLSEEEQQAVIQVNVSVNKNTAFIMFSNSM